MFGQTVSIGACTTSDPCLDVITPIPFEYVTDDMGNVDSFAVNIGFTGGTPPYDIIIEQVLTENCYLIGNDFPYFAQRLSIVDANGCTCSLVYTLVQNGHSGVFPDCPFSDSQSALAYYEGISDWTTQAEYFSNSFNDSPVPYFESGWNPLRDDVTSFSTECGFASDVCPNIITEAFTNDDTYEILTTFSTTANYPVDYQINQLTGCNSPLVSGSGTVTTPQSVPFSVPTTSCSNGQWQVTAEDTQGCTDTITFNVSSFEDNIPCIDFDVTEETDFSTCLVTLTATGGTVPYDWSQVQTEFPNVTINASGDVATFNQCDINGGVGAGIIDSNAFDANGCVKVVRVIYNTDAACCDVNCQSCLESNITGCPVPVYEGQDEFLGNDASSTTLGNGSGVGCAYWGAGTPNQLGAGTGNTYTHCVSYTANTDEVSFPFFLSAANSGCLDISVDMFQADDCSVAGVTLVQPIGATPATATGMIAGTDYTVCYNITENGCTDDFNTSLFEICTSVLELPYCSAVANPQSVTLNSGQAGTLDLGTCVVDNDQQGTSGYAIFQMIGGGTFPTGQTFSDLQGQIDFLQSDCNNTNLSAGGGCTPISIQPITNTTGAPIVIEVGVINVDVSSACSAILNILTDCEFYVTTITILPEI